ncbi:MAG: hypothetical protein ACE5GT_08320, partial [Rhodospirillales bacterium]
MSGYVVQLLWGLLVLSALVGWGRAVGRLAGGPPGDQAADPPDWGLAAGWGMAALLAAGGVLALAGLARPWVLVALVLGGAAIFAVGLVRRPPRFKGRAWTFWLLVCVVVVPLVTRYAGAVSYQAMSCTDDDIAYFTYVARLLQTGTLLEPFSLRRLSGYGGQTFLQALVVVIGDEDNAYLVDRGVAFIISFGLVVGFFRGFRAAPAVPILAALALTVILPLPLLNSSSHVTGLTMLLTLFRTLHRLPAADPTPGPAPGPAGRRRLWLIGLVAAGVASLKATFLVMAAVTVFAYWLIRALSEGGSVRRQGAALAHLAASSLVFLAPWAALLWRSSGTVLFPLFQGNHRPGFAETYSGAMALGERLHLLADFFLSPQVALFLTPLVVYAFRRGSPAGLALYAGVLATATATVSTLTYDDLETLHRYAAPFLNAAFIASVVYFLDLILGPAPGAAARGSAWAAGDGILCLLVVLLLPVPVYHDIQRLTGAVGGTGLAPGNRAVYTRMQAAVPAGARLFAVVNHPFALDYRRNPV